MTISIPLSLAQLCSDCSEVSISGSGDRCPICGSRALLNLSKVLNREPHTDYPPYDTIRQMLGIALGR